MLARMVGETNMVVESDERAWKPTTVKADYTPHIGVRRSRINGHTFLRLLCLDSLARFTHLRVEYSIWPSSGMPGGEDEGKVADWRLHPACLHSVTHSLAQPTSTTQCPSFQSAPHSWTQVAGGSRRDGPDLMLVCGVAVVTASSPHHAIHPATGSQTKQLNIEYRRRSSGVCDVM